MLTDEQIKFLKYIYNPKTIKQICVRFKLRDYHDINSFFRKNPLLWFNYSDFQMNDDTFVELTNQAKAVVEKYRRDKKKHVFSAFHIWLNSIIAVLAFVLSVIAFFRNR